MTLLICILMLTCSPSQTHRGLDGGQTFALIQRLNRKLHDEELMIRTSRPGSRAEFDLGRHYIIGVRIGGVVHSNIDLEAWGRDAGVLRPYERLGD